MLRSRVVCAAIFPVALLPSCSLLIDTNPDGVIDKAVAGSGGKANSRAGGGTNGGVASSSSAARSSNGNTAGLSDTTPSSGGAGTNPVSSTGQSGAGATESSGGAGGTPSPEGTGGINAGGVSTTVSTQGGDAGGTGGAPSTSRTDATGGITTTGGAPQTGGAATGGAPQTGGAATGGAPQTGGAATGGAATGGAATGGTTSAATCNDEGCACTGTGTIPCNDCGTRTCSASTKRWGACSAPQNPAATKCSSGTTLQTCGSDGKWKSTTCSTSDATNCSASCVTSGTSSACKVAAKDADADGHSAKFCTAAPGDDCDDSNKSVHPGAVEVCDGVDNDCNGKADLNDGLPFTGTTRLDPGHYQMHVAWWPTLQRFALVAAQSGDEGIYWGAATRNAANDWRGTRVGEHMLGSDIDPRLLWLPGVGSFVVAYSSAGIGGSSCYLYSVNDLAVASGRLGFGSGHYGASPSFALRANGDVLIAHGNRADTFVSVYNGSTISTAATVTGQAAIANRVAVSGNVSAVIYQLEESTVVRWFRLNAALAAGGPTTLSSAGRFPDIASITEGFATAWATAAGFDYQVVSSTGSVVCGPTHVPFGNGTLDADDAVAVAATQYGTLVLATDAGGTQVRLARFDNACKVVDNQQANTDAVPTSRPVIAVGGGLTALTWQKFGAFDSYTRVMGEALCN